MLLYMGVVGFVCYIIPLFSMEPNIHTKTTNVGLIITLFALACYIIPIFMNAYRYNKKLANRNYSCPISRFALFNVNYLVGLINIINLKNLMKNKIPPEMIYIISTRKETINLLLKIKNNLMFLNKN